MTKYIRNILAALITSIAAISLGASFGILSGRGAFIGMFSSAVIAIITSGFGGTRIQCSGPTAPMSAVSAVVIAYGFENFSDILANQFANVVFILAGLIILIMGIFRLGKYIRLIPNVVISGFMNGIALLIWINQIQKLFGLGDNAPIGGVFWQNIVLVIVTIGVIFLIPPLLEKYAKKIKGFFPGTLIALAGVTALKYFLGFDVELTQMDASIHSFDELKSFFAVQTSLSQVDINIIQKALPFAFSLAVLGYLDSLLTSLVIDRMMNEETKKNKELMAQGFANSVTGFLGGIPGAQATIRCVLLLKEGATMRITGVLVGIFILIELFLFQDILSLIPQAVFSGILIKVGYDVFDWKPVKLYFKEMRDNPQYLFNNPFSEHKKDKVYVTNSEILMIFGTMLTTVFFTLNTAVIGFTVLFHGINRFFLRKEKLRDLEILLETEGFSDEN